MQTDERIAIMNEISRNILEYLQEELSINTVALKAYDNDSPIQEKDPEIKRIREIEAVKLRDRIHELTRHIAVIKRMVPTGK